LSCLNYGINHPTAFVLKCQIDQSVYAHPIKVFIYTAEMKHIILGLGKTGLSFARYLGKKKIPFTVVDTRTHPPCLDEFKQTFPFASVYLGHELKPELLQQADMIYLSPGIALNHPILSSINHNPGTNLVSDIELFARNTQVPIVAITGTNAKGTVTTLVETMASYAQCKVKVGGNIGNPALGLLDDYEPDVYVLEISSFQLETTQSLRAHVATVLNVSDDHQDRHLTRENYIAIKQRVYQNCKIAVWNRNDRNTYPHDYQKNISFGIDPSETEFGVRTMHDQPWLCYGKQPWLPTEELSLTGCHNWANALAALAIAQALELPRQSSLAALRNFKGLPHRCQLVAEKSGVRWYNDSKATNVGACAAAISGLAPKLGKIILIAGGLAKDADFYPLRPLMKDYVKHLILIGTDAPLLRRALQDTTQITDAHDLMHAVELAQQKAQSNDIVLLSPACASLDMFENYEARGKYFSQLVKQL
jgi:UDP-N-acetylmuramoylalanine--D-glutamate ligase